MVDSEQSLPKEMLFIQVVSMFQVAAMQQLGKLMDPLAGDVKRDLAQAKVSIDILDVLKEKTKGNLTSHEEEFLKKVLFELHMNYVEELKKPDQSEDAEGAKSEGPGGDESQAGAGKDEERDD
jgi:hypothetical protein